MRTKTTTVAAIAILTACLTLFVSAASWADQSHPAVASGVCVKASAKIVPHSGLHVGDDYCAFTGVSDCGPRGDHSPLFKFRFVFAGPCIKAATPTTAFTSSTGEESVSRVRVCESPNSCRSRRSPLGFR